MKNQTLESIAKRYTCRDFLDTPISDEDLELITLAAVQSPSGMNRQNWQIIALQNRDIIEELDREGMRFMQSIPGKFMYDRIMGRGGKMLYNAPCAIIIAIKEAEPKGAELIDLGIVAQNICLAATSLGIASCHCGMMVFPFAGERGEELKQKLHFWDGYQIGMGVLLGYPKKENAPHSPDLTKVSIIR